MEGPIFMPPEGVLQPTIKQSKKVSMRAFGKPTKGKVV